MNIKQQVYTTKSGDQVRLGKELGRGGQGAVFKIVGEQQMVAKIYFSLSDDRISHKLYALVQSKDEVLQRISAWPEHILYNAEGSVSGFVMPLVSEKEYYELHNLYRMSSRRQLFPKADWRFMAHVARNVARAFVVLHSRQCLMGDVSSRNIMVSPNGVVKLIDIDSFQIKYKSVVYPCSVATAEFTPPELQNQTRKSTRVEKHDLFGLALLIFHLLFEGRHPYAGVHDNGVAPSPAEAIAADKFAYSLRHRHGVHPPPGAMTLGQLHPDLQRLFERAFAPSHRNRPKAADWEVALAQLTENMSICSENGSHRYDQRMPCQWCVLKAISPTLDTHSRIKRFDSAGELRRVTRLLQSVPAPSAPVSQQPKLGNIASQPLPDVPPQPPIEPHFLSGAALRAGLFIFAFLFAMLNGWSWHYCLSFFVFAVSDTAKNAPQNLMRRKYENELSAMRSQRLEYQSSLQKHLLELERNLEQLQKQLKDAYRRQQSESAQTRYHIHIKFLEDMYREVEYLDMSENQELKRVLDFHYQSALSAFLQEYKIENSGISGFNFLTFNSLHKQGIVTANDIGPHLSQIKGLKPRRQRELMEWRETLEQFFNFDPQSIPKKHFNDVKTQLDQKKMEKIKEMEDFILQLHENIQIWKVHEKIVDKEIRKIRFGIYSLEKSIENTKHELDNLEFEHHF